MSIEKAGVNPLLIFLINRISELKVSCKIQVDTAFQTIYEKDEQLIKAKEIIKKLMHSLKNEGSDYTFALENTHPVLTEAEQFLNEVEK